MRTGPTTRRRASDEKRRSDHRLYVAEMGLAQQAWHESQMDQVREHLQSAVPARPGDADLRGFEWFFLRRLCDSSARTLRGHSGAIYGLAFSPDGRRVVSAGFTDGSLKTWDVGSGHLIKSQDGPAQALSCVAYSHDGRTIASAGNSDNTVHLWDAASGTLIRTLRGHTAQVGSVEFSPDSNRCATASSDQTIKVWNIGTGKLLHSLSGHSKGIKRLAFGPDGRAVAAPVWTARSRSGTSAPGALRRTLNAHPTAFGA